MLEKIKSFLFENQSIKQKIAKNTFWLFFGQITGRTLRAVLIIFAARVLGPESWGAFSYAMGLAAFMIIFSDIGISAIVTRESAKNLRISSQYFSTAFCIKILLLLIGSTLLIFGAPYLTNIKEAQTLMPLIAIILIFDSLRNFGFAISRAHEKMQWEAINEIATNIFITLFGIYALYKMPTSANLTAAYIAGTAIGFLLIAFLFKKYYSEIFKHFNANLIKPLIKSSLPYALASFLGAIMINTDLIMLGWLRSPAEVGFYSAAQKPILLLYTLAALFATSLFPTLTKIATGAKEDFKELLEKSLKIALLVAIPTAIGGILLAPEIIFLLYGSEYLPATLSFRILLPTLIIIFPSIIISNSLLAHNQQKKFVGFSILGAIGNIMFNWILIIPFGIAGCAISTLLTQIIANAFIWQKMKEVNDFSIFNKLKKIICASSVMAIAAWTLNYSGSPVLLTIPAAIIIYFALLTKTFKEELLV